jgi:hypothetical protein
MKHFRVHDGTVVVDIPVHPQPGDRVWVATMWPDHCEQHGWAREACQPGPHGRGFVPAAMELGDVIEFGTERPPAGRDRRGSPPARPPAHWYGYVHAIAPEGLLLRSPYPHPAPAHAAAQQALLTWARAAQQAAERTRARPDDAAHEPAVEPAQPPATVTVAFHGPTATVGDPKHGWLTVPADRFAAALTRPPAELAALLTRCLPTLCGREPPITLVALAARHLPGHPPPGLYPATPPPGRSQELNLP